MRSKRRQDRYREEQRKGFPLRTALGILIFAIGFGVVVYPAVSNLWNRYRQSQLTQSYDQALGQAEEEDLTAMWEAAWEYNANLAGNFIGDAFEGALAETETSTAAETETSTAADGSDPAADGEGSEISAQDDVLYQSLLNVAGDGVMGYLSIPEINVSLPIYHGTGSEELQKGIGHLYGTSLPVGGASTHTVLAGHRGLPGAALLTDLDYLETGDFFFLYILDEVLAYEVISVEIVEPTQTDSLAVQEGEDLATIVTCTPYGVNT
ncbi:MAG: class C sortase, partial [Lachnospiraceae bacterium]|nr:class C sortase [Lachnospiraceae bacterium]